ncbi:OB-fold protein [Flagellimonas sp.]|uniref:OB-fold protein n=1 Tax=Flagellimonas sp. TaxID=2058762 RepID=UPI003BB17FEB
MRSLTRKNRLTLWMAVGLLILGICMVWYIMSTKTIDMANAEPELYISANDLVDLLEKKDAAGLLSAEKVIEITGAIKEINEKNNRLTVILHVEGKEHPSIICDMMEGQEHLISKFEPTDTLVIKGVFKGILKDAIFLNCVVSHE